MMLMRSPRLATIGSIIPLLLLALLGGVVWGQQPQSDADKAAQRQKEEREDYYQKWLNEDVVYIISESEREVFKSLRTPQEKDQFIEQFWYRRDPDLRTAVNEFKEEHYRRIAYANERFTSGVPGWKTDRGKIYIIHGEPAEIEKHQGGESYQRPSHEGGGFTVVYAFQIWRYRYIEGLGSDVEIEFVDPSGSGEFRLAKNPWEKDARLFVPGTGLTIAEELGLAERADRAYWSPATADVYPGMNHRAIDDPFIRYERLIEVQRPQAVKYKDLQELVKVDVKYDQLPFDLRTDYFALNDQSVLVPLTIELQNKDLTFVEENGVRAAHVAIYGIVTSITNRVISEFDHDLVLRYRPEEMENALGNRSIYQKVIMVDKNVRHRLDLVLKDLNAGTVGVTRAALVPPSFMDSEELKASSLVLSDFVESVEDPSRMSEMFVIGDLKVRPNPSKEFSATKPFGVYLQVYNATIDQTTLRPSLSVFYRILRDGKQVKYWSDLRGQSVQFSSGQRIVLLKPLPLSGLEPDRYTVQVEVEDQISGKKLSLSDSFRIKGSQSSE